MEGGAERGGSGSRESGTNDLNFRAGFGGGYVLAHGASVTLVEVIPIAGSLGFDRVGDRGLSNLSVVWG